MLPQSPCSQCRAGWTLIELLAVIGLISLLAGLLLPAIQSARGSAWEVEDANSVRQLTLGSLHFHDTFGRLPGPYTGRVGIQEGWSFAALSYLDGDNLLSQFNPDETIDHSGNLKIASRSRPRQFVSKVVMTGDTPFSIESSDDPSRTFLAKPADFATNGFLLAKRLGADVRETHRTALFARFGATGCWNFSTEFYALPEGNQVFQLIGFADGSVARRISGDVVLDP